MLRGASWLGKAKCQYAVLLLTLLIIAASVITLPVAATESELVKVHFIDVGQGDSILIQTPNSAVLVDGGPGSAGQKIVDYLRQHGIGELYAVVATHPHEDHIGGLVKVVDEFPIKNFYMPNKEHTTITFENLVYAVIDSGARRIQARSGVEFELDGVRFEFLAPVRLDYSNLNDYSAVIKVIHGKNSFLLAGDAEREAERDMLLEGLDLKADVLKVGHHGSETSTSSEFLIAVWPKYAVISVGEGNSYGHPHRHVLNMLEIAGASVYRTDELGTIVTISDGETLTFVFEKDETESVEVGATKEKEPETEVKEITVYITRTGSKYHRSGCRYLRQSRIPISLSEAKRRGYGACSVCRPPS